MGFPSELDGALVVRKPLDYETATNLTVTLRAQDGGSPPRHNDTTLTIVVMDADDQNPTFTHDHYSAVIPEDAREVLTRRHPLWKRPRLTVRDVQ